MKLSVVSGKDTVKAFGKLGYVTVRQPYSNEASIRSFQKAAHDPKP